MGAEPTPLGAMTWTDLAGTDLGRPECGERFVVVPIGSCEQHGPHLPLDTDTVIATALANDLAGRRGDCLVSPPVTISASGEHQGFPGTLSIGTEAMTTVIIELARSADWAAGVVFLNGHGGNLAAMQRASAVFRSEARNVLIWWPSIPGGDPHAGHTETSLMLALAPDRVRRAAAVPGPIPPIDDLIRHGVRPLSPTGVLGDPTLADADDGHRILGRLTDDLATAVAGWAGDE